MQESGEWMLPQVETLAWRGRQAHACCWPESVARACLCPTAGGRLQQPGREPWIGASEMWRI